MATIKTEVEVLGERGLHLRPAYQIVECAKNFQAKLEFVYKSERVDGRSILSIVSLGAAEGAKLELEAHGDDAEELAAAIVELFVTGFPIATADNKA